MDIFHLMSSGPKSEIARKAEASSVSSEVWYPQRPNIDLNAWNLPGSWFVGSFITDIMAADSYEWVILENSRNLSVGYVPSYLLPNITRAATPVDICFGTFTWCLRSWSRFCKVFVRF